MKQNRNRRQARLYAFQSLYAKEFHKPEDSVIMPEEESGSTGAMDIAYAEAIINGVTANQEILDNSVTGPLAKTQNRAIRSG